MLQLKNEMLQGFEKPKRFFRSHAGRITCGLALTMGGWTAGTLVQTAAAQTPAAQAPAADSQAPADSQVPATTAAPGTVAISRSNAAALAASAYTGPKYTERFEVYGGLSFMNGQAGQNLSKRYNMGGAEVQATYWLGGPADGYFRRHVGLTVDDRFGAGTTPVISPYYNRVVIMQNVFSGGVTFRGPRNRYAAMAFHGLAGGSDGIFDYAVNHYPGGSPVSSCAADQKPGQRDNLGLYCNHVAPWGAAGGSIDFNESAKLAIRLQPDMVFEHFGTETREFFSISAGVVYRLGKVKK